MHTTILTALVDLEPVAYVCEGAGPEFLILNLNEDVDDDGLHAAVEDVNQILPDGWFARILCGNRIQVCEGASS